MVCTFILSGGLLLAKLSHFFSIKTGCSKPVSLICWRGRIAASAMPHPLALALQVFGLGFVSVFDQILEGVPTDREAIFSAYIRALDEDPQQYRADASKLEEWASKISDPAELQPASDSDDPIRKRLSEIAQAAKDGKFLYTRFFAIGLFRLLELSKAKDPQALQSLVKSMNISNDSVNRDLMTYKVVPAPVAQIFTPRPSSTETSMTVGADTSQMQRVAAHMHFMLVTLLQLLSDLPMGTFNERLQYRTSR